MLTVRHIIFAALLAMVAAPGAIAQHDTTERLPWLEPQGRAPAPRSTAARRNDAYRPAEEGAGLGTLGQAPQQPYGRQDGYGAPAPRYEDEARQPGYGQGPYAQPPPYQSGPAYGRGEDAYRPPYQSGPAQGPYASNSGGFGQPYSPSPETYQDDQRYGAGRPAYGSDRYGEHRGDGTYSSNEIVSAGHSFFGTVSKGLANAIEYVFQRQGRPNGYILGEDAGGAFIAGLRYGEGTLYTKDAGSHRVYWQGPTIGYDAGAEGSKVMVLVYNLRDPGEIYDRFPGVSGSAYVIGGVSLNFQAKDHIVLAPIRSGLGLRLGANIGYLKYTPRPTWNPF